MRKGANIGERLNLCVTKGGAFAATTDHRQSVPKIMHRYAQPNAAFAARRTYTVVPNYETIAT